MRRRNIVKLLQDTAQKRQVAEEKAQKEEKFLQECRKKFLTRTSLDREMDRLRKVVEAGEKCTDNPIIIENGYFASIDLDKLHPLYAFPEWATVDQLQKELDDGIETNSSRLVGKRLRQLRMCRLLKQGPSMNWMKQDKKNLFDKLKPMTPHWRNWISTIAWLETRVFSIATDSKIAPYKTYLESGNMMFIKLSYINTCCWKSILRCRFLVG